VTDKQRNDYENGDPNDRIGKIGYGGCLIGIILIGAFVFLLPLCTWRYDWRIDEHEVKNVEVPSTKSQQTLILSKGFSIEVHDDPAGRVAPIVVLRDKKRNVIWSVTPEESKSIRFDSWIYMPFHSIRVKGKMTFDEGPQKDIMFLVYPNGKLKTIYGTT
jgi:hypothetical protein